MFELEMLAKDRQQIVKRSSKTHPMIDIARRVLLQYLASKQNFVLNSRDSSSE